MKIELSDTEQFIALTIIVMLLLSVSAIKGCQYVEQRNIEAIRAGMTESQYGMWTKPDINK